MKVTNGHRHVFHEKRIFSVLELETLNKDQIMANSMRTACRHFRAHLMPFRSSDVTNVISGKTAITPSFLKLKTSKPKLIPDVISNEANHKNDMILQNNGRKTSFKNVTMVTKNVAYLYLSNSER